jgi:hypothetical protein
MTEEGLWKYSGDAQETLQAQCKSIWLDFSARGAAGRNSPPEVLMQRHFMKTHMCCVEYGPHELIALQHEQRRLLDLQARAEEIGEYSWEEVKKV